MYLTNEFVQLIHDRGEGQIPGALIFIFDVSKDDDIEQGSAEKLFDKIRKFGIADHDVILLLIQHVSCVFRRDRGTYLMPEFFEPRFQPRQYVMFMNAKNSGHCSQFLLRLACQDIRIYQFLLGLSKTTLSGLRPALDSTEVGNFLSNRKRII